MHLSAIVDQQLWVDCHVSYRCMMDSTVSMTCSGMAVHVYITLDTGMSQAFWSGVWDSYSVQKIAHVLCQVLCLTKLTILPNHR